MNLKKVIASSVALSGTIAATGIAANADTIVVQNGDTLSKLAHEHNTTVDEIVNVNKLSNRDLIFVGDKLEINDTDGKTTTAAQTATTTTNNQQTATAPAQQAAPVQQQGTQPAVTSSVAGGDAAAKEWIAQRESGGSYSAANGQYIGRYQLSASYLNGDYSPANQERVADQYVASRYGSWSNAQAFWQSHGWY
ncbi:LysM peptidoglycan-binding domain-containing protein [Ligilactobacillus equi]|uniref:Aggregation promoting factor n=1 Tax=Ligilactobacillus equi DSM 15833 = JCM 10991 TaxID=1423740 RepID=A0A0R1THR2_9LACO|nr:LysM domain-containing protein [Ligilactobacillus equi]KRL78261.1 aggregation promoting factor [Ligilactobacillus equi DSM 15833 = JCM 10991]